jgi:metallo-beta-lactamase class B
MKTQLKPTTAEPGQAPDLEALGKNPPLFLQMAVNALGWNEPSEPVKAVGPINFVGTRGLGVWLITTSEGNNLLNTVMPQSGPLIEASIRKLGFKPEEIKLLLSCHAHVDHVGGHAYIKKVAPDSKVTVIDSEVDLVQSGGKSDFFYGTYPEFAFEPVKVDMVFHDGDTIKLGDVALTAIHAPGHAKGATTFVTNVVDGGKVYTVVFPDGTSVNPGYRVAKDESYPGIGDEFRRSFHSLEMLKPDIWLPGHLEIIDFEGKRATAVKEGVKAWVDPEG